MLLFFGTFVVKAPLQAQKGGLRPAIHHCAPSQLSRYVKDAFLELSSLYRNSDASSSLWLNCGHCAVKQIKRSIHLRTGDVKLFNNGVATTKRQRGRLVEFTHRMTDAPFFLQVTVARGTV